MTLPFKERPVLDVQFRRADVAGDSRARADLHPVFSRDASFHGSENFNEPRLDRRLDVPFLAHHQTSEIREDLAGDFGLHSHRVNKFHHSYNFHSVAQTCDAVCRRSKRRSAVFHTEGPPSLKDGFGARTSCRISITLARAGAVI